MHGLAEDFRRLHDDVELAPLALARQLAALEQRAVQELSAAEREAYAVRKLAALERVARSGRPARGFARDSAAFAAELAVNEAEGAALPLRVRRFLDESGDESPVERLLGAVDLLWEIDSFDEERRVRGEVPPPPPLAPIAAERDRLVARLGAALRAADGATTHVELLRALRQRVEAMVLERDERSHYERAAAWRRTRELIRDLRAAAGDLPAPARKELARHERRCAGMAQEARLEIRTEQLLGTRGAALVGQLRIGLVLVLLLLLTIDLLVAQPTGWLRPLVLLDTAVCCLLLAECLLRLCLVPGRLRWLLRHALTDVLPSLPLAFLIAGRKDADLKELELGLWLSWLARSLLAVGPLLRLLRFLVAALRWLDEVVERLAPVLNRDFVAFEHGVAAVRTGSEPLTPPTLLRRIGRRQRLALQDAGGDERARFLGEQALELARFFRARQGSAADGSVRSRAFRLRTDPDRDDRSVEVERAIEALWRVEPHELEDHIGRRAVLALARFLGVLGLPVVRSLPLVRPFAQAARKADPEERVVAAARAAAAWLERWHGRALAFADLSGILTAPQLLDRIASAVMKATQRPAVRLLLFGTLFVLFRGLFETVLRVSLGSFGRVIGNFVTRPLLVIGSVCLVVLLVARWLKKIAGEASESLQRTADAQFLELVKLRKSASLDHDLQRLADRVFAPEAELHPADSVFAEPVALRGALRELVQERRGQEPGPVAAAAAAELEHAVLLYLHYLDGPIFHRGDVRMSVQLLSNLNLERIRSERFGFDKAARKRLKKLDLEDGTLFSGPYLWFQFMAESVALEVARLLTEYNRSCRTRAELLTATAEESAQFAEWLRRRREGDSGRAQRRQEARRARAAGPERLLTTEFTALDFLVADPAREARVAQLFGPEVLAILQQDRRRLVREVFGTRPLHRLPRARRTFNPYAFYRDHLAGGRALLLPLWWLRLWGRGLLLLVRKVVATTREILFPELVRPLAIESQADFAVAVRKINRMRKPLFMEALRLRARFDLAYSGLPVPGGRAAAPSLLEQDLEFIGADARERAPILQEVEAARAELGSFHRWFTDAGRDLVPHLPEPDGQGEERRRALLTAWVSDAFAIRTLAQAPADLERIVAHLSGAAGRVAIPLLRRAVLLAQAAWRLLRRRPSAAEAAFHAFLAHALAVRPPAFALRRRLLAAFRVNHLGLRRLALAWHGTLAEGGVAAALRQRVARVWRHPEQITRELLALRTVQTLAVLDIEAYRRLVFELGGYAQDGADAALDPRGAE